MHSYLIVLILGGLRMAYALRKILFFFYETYILGFLFLLVFLIGIENFPLFSTPSE